VEQRQSSGSQRPKFWRELSKSGAQERNETISWDLGTQFRRVSAILYFALGEQVSTRRGDITNNERRFTGVFISVVSWCHIPMKRLQKLSNYHALLAISLPIVAVVALQ